MLFSKPREKGEKKEGEEKTEGDFYCILGPD
jgi:hypothetical protein